MVDELRGARLLRGFRGAPPADEAALRDVLLRVSALLSLAPEVQELDINPVHRAALRRVRVADVRVRIERRGGGAIRTGGSSTEAAMTYERRARPRAMEPLCRRPQCGGCCSAAGAVSGRRS